MALAIICAPRQIPRTAFPDSIVLRMNLAFITGQFTGFEQSIGHTRCAMGHTAQPNICIEHINIAPIEPVTGRPRHELIRH